MGAGARRAFSAVVALLLLFTLATPVSAGSSSTEKTQIASLPVASGGTITTKPKAAAAKQASGAAADRPKESQGVQVAALTRGAIPSAGLLIEDAIESCWAEYSEQAGHLLDQVVTSYPGTREAALARALQVWVLASANRTDEASALADQVVADAADPEMSAFAAMLRDAYVALHNEDVSRAVAAYGAAADVWTGTPTGAWAAIALGDVYRDEVGDYAAAHRVYDEVAADYAGTAFEAEAVVSAADCLSWYEDRDAEAQEKYRQALQLSPIPRLRVRAELGIARCTEGAAEEYDALGDLIERYPENPMIIQARSDRARVAYELGHLEEAAQDAAAVIDSPLRQPETRQSAHAILGDCLFREGRLAEAEEQFLVGLALPASERAEESRLLAELANCRAAQGDLAGAASYFRQAAETAVSAGADAEGDAASHYYLGTAAFYQADFEAARSEYKLMETVGTGMGLAVAGAQGAASCLMAKGDYAAATAEYESLVERYPSYPQYCAEARYQIGDMLCRQQRYQEALVQFNRVLSEFPATSWVAVARERITETDGALATQGEAAR